ncbi:MAG: GreA/GreB family elongation factor [Bellilinea sp.]
MGKALLGRKVGEEVMADTPGGSVRFKILRIE